MILNPVLLIEVGILWVSIAVFCAKSVAFIHYIQHLYLNE